MFYVFYVLLVSFVSVRDPSLCNIPLLWGNYFLETSDFAYDDFLFSLGNTVIHP